MWNTNPIVLNTDFKVMIMGDSCRNINLPKGDIPPFFILLYCISCVDNHIDNDLSYLINIAQNNRMSGIKF